METQRAVDQLSQIYAQISKTEMYQGFRARSVAVTGLSALLAINLQPYWVTLERPETFLRFWVFIAVVNTLFIGGVLAYRYFYQDSEWERHKTRNMLMQFGPALLAGMAITLLTYHADQNLTPYLPGIWSLTFGLGVLAARPYLSTNLFWCGMYYLAASMVLFWLAPLGLSLSSWGMGLTFGFGQLLAAAVMYWDIERYEA